MDDVAISILSMGSIFFILICSLLYMVVLFGGLAFWAFMLVDAVQRENYVNKDDKTTWILVLALTGLIGAAIYYFTVKKKLDAIKA